MRFIADLEVHSPYARAVSPQMTLENLALWAKKKGILVLGTGDITHPLWFQEIKTKLEPGEPGLFRLRGSDLETRFLLSGEVSCIYSKAGKVRRVHHLVYFPTLEAAEKANARLGWIGNLKADGRPMLGLDSKELLKIVLDASPESALIPAHIWTPWFGLLGSKSGFDSLEACFDELAPQVFAIETGLSSDPPMNWRVPFLDEKAIISGSDAHSLHRLGREAMLFDTELSYRAIMEAIRHSQCQEFVATVEFFPEEGKYHYDGHAACGVRLTPQETKREAGHCPRCGKQVTVGVMARVEELAAPNRPLGFAPAWGKKYYNFVPLDEVIAATLGVRTNSKAVWRAYDAVIQSLGSEFNALLFASEDTLRSQIHPGIAEGLIRMRNGKVKIEAGYDGTYGKVSLFDESERANLGVQKSLF